MKKLRLISLLLAVLMIFATLGFSSAGAESSPITSRHKLLMALEMAMRGEKTGATYKPGVVEAFRKASNDAALVYINEYSTEKEIVTALHNLENAMLGMETYNLYQDGLHSAFAYIRSLKAEDYTEESFAAIKEALKKEHDYHYCTSQQEIDDAVNAINEAVSNLVPVNGGSAPTETPEQMLRRYYNLGRYYLSADCIYTNKSEETLYDAVVDAELTLDPATTADAKVYEYNAKNIIKAIEGLEILTFYMDDLQSAVTDGYYYYENEYRFSEDSYEKFMWTYYSSRARLSNAQSQEEVDKAADDLYVAIQMLVPEDRRGDYMTAQDRFNELWTIGNVYVYVEGITFEEGCRQNMLDAVNATSQYTHSNQLYEEYIEACELLEKAIANMKIADCDKSELLKAIEECQIEDANIYTYESYTEYNEAFIAAVDAYDNATTQEEVNRAKQAFLLSYGRLVIAETAPATEPQEATTVPASSEVITTEPEEPTVPATTESTEINTTEPTEIITIPPVTTATVSTEPDASETQASESTATTPQETITYMVGDTDLNGKVSIKDATTIQKHLAKIAELTGTALLSADTTQDANISIKDATEIQKFLANLPANINIGKEITTVA